MSYVYALINPAVPGRVKVGQTTREPKERLKEINSGAGVAGRWKFVKAVAVQAGFELKAEQAAHARPGRQVSRAGREDARK